MADSEAHGTHEPAIDDELTLIFDVHINKKYGLVKPEVQHLVIQRSGSSELSILTQYLETNLELRYGDGKKLLLHALCNKFEVRVAGQSRTIKNVVPLVCDQVWALILAGYPHSQLKVLVEQNRPTAALHKKSSALCIMGFLKRELLFLNVAAYLPSKTLASDHVMDLCRDIFERGMKIKPELRKGVWLHLVGVFHPNLKSREDRELYFNSLRRVYDSLRGKWIGIDDNDEVRHLLDAVRRDAVRTDPGNPFYAISDAHYSSRINLCESSDEDNIQKLVNIITIYTLEHSTCAYTQGMTDILSPILYIMKHEADAYICFSAMVERIRNHFETWCVGTLLKLERLKHLCEVLDPALYHHLKESIEEDAFALFFGMVLIECRREFSFEDSFHLLEAIWAAVACMKDSLPRTTHLSLTEWAAHYMTQESPDVIQQVMGETQSPYSAVPLPRSDSMVDTHSRSRQASMLSQGSMLPQEQFRSSIASGNLSSSRLISHSQAIEEENERSSGESSSLVEVSISEVPEKRVRSYTDPGDSKCGSRSPDQSDPSSSSTKKKGLSDSHSESELLDSYNSQPPPVKPKSKSSAGSSRAVTEMSDMSSLSSNNALANSYKSFDSRNAVANGAASAASDRSRSPAKLVNGHHSPSQLSGGNVGEDSPDFNIGGGGDERAMIGLKPREDEKGRSSEASTLVSVDLHNGSSVKEPTAISSPVAMNGVSPNPASSSSEFQDALSTLPNDSQREDQNSPSPSQPSSSEIYQTATDGSSATDLPSRSVSQSPSLQHLDYEEHAGTIIPTVINGDVHDIHSADEEATPVHTRANGTIVQGMGVGEHREVDVLDGESVPFSPPELEEDEGGASVGSDKIRRENLTEQTSHARPKSKGVHVDCHRSRTNPSRSSPLDIYDEDAISGSSRVTPVPFFDAMVQLASSAPGSNFLQSGQLHRSLIDGEEREEENELEMSQANSMILSQLVSTDRAAPRVTRERSLDLPVSDCFPLFICLSILIQNRTGIMQRSIDFVGLSVLLNAQAGMQDLDETLAVAKNLYKTYREYQMTVFGSKPEDLDTWLDDDRTSISNDNNDEDGDEEPSPVDGDFHNVNDRTSVASDDVFNL